MTKKLFAVAAAVMSACAVQAVQMSYSDNGADTLIQSYDSGTIVPGNPTSISVQFAQFYDWGGWRTLQSVTVSVTQSMWGGYYAVDNDSESVATIEAHHGVSGYATETVSGYSLPIEVRQTLQTFVFSGTQSLAANNSSDDSGSFNWDGGGITIS